LENIPALGEGLAIGFNDLLLELHLRFLAA
jgi:hypothetical protein